MRVRDYLGISTRRQRQLTRLMQVTLVGVFLVGVVEANLGVIVNGGVALAITYLPAIIERDYEIPLDAGLTLWITAAVFLHAVGTLGPYQDTWWWDHVTHLLSASVVAAAGYAAARAVDEHSEQIHLPPRFMFVFILVFVLAFGVLWEVIEFTLGGLSSVLGGSAVLTQYGLTDTMLDLVFDVVGGLVVAIWGTAYLTNVSDALAERLDSRANARE